ncbi:MAG: M15 family metallopeptidase [Oscillospiraceae bacterium]|nr:M15 family metallopeptidase [Oscillospiraceae bacterium]
MRTPVSYLGRRLSPYVRVAMVVVLSALAVFTAVRIHSWNTFGERSRVMTLVNPWNPVSETGYTAKLTEVEDGYQMDRVCADALRRMLTDCRAAGRNALIADAYRSVDDQLVLHDAEVQRLVDGGMTPEAAEWQVSKVIAAAGRSEHEMGLAVDIVDADNPVTDETQAETPTSQWLRENAWRYGFILRYPPDAEEITGYSWHPWHYRYVGEDAAGNIQALGITLEEYLSLFYSDEAQVVYDKG